MARRAHLFGLVLFSLTAAAPLANADPALQSFLEATLAAARAKDHLPAVAAVIQINGKIEAEAALGQRALGHPEAVTVNDRWHIGSDTKAITATLIARLVDQHVMSFDDTLAACLPMLAKDMHAGYRNITVAQLLSHASGLPPMTDDKDLPEYKAVTAPFADLRAQRLALAKHYLAKPPASKAGDFNYSNLGFIIAGAIAEVKTGKAWEDLVREQVFAPLGIVNAGFGLPGTPGKADQPWGHEDTNGKLVALDPANPDGDNPPSLGPAGLVNIALKDWLLFAQDQLDGAHGRGKLLRPETYKRLQTPVAPAEAPIYAFGWGVKLGPNGVPDLITHSGSNGFWLADVRIMPKHDMIFLVVTNAGNDAANEAVKDIGKPLRERLKPFE